MRKQTKKKKRDSPLPFLLLLCLFCAVLTYFWDLRYVPIVPEAEIPPFLAATTESKPSDALLQSDNSDGLPGSVTDRIPEAIVPETERTDTENPIPTLQTEVHAQSEQPVFHRKNSVYNFLVVGKDGAAANTDVLILLSFDTENGSASVVQIPRDTYLDGGKINALWAKYSAAAKRIGSADSTADGMQRLCRTLEEALCIRIDHWVFCSLAALRETVDAMGGVTLDVPCDMDYEDPAQNLSIHLKKGTQTLDGAAAEQFVRFRSGYLRGDLGRTEAQKLFLSALLAQLKTVSPLKLPALVAAAVKYVDMSLTVKDILFFAKAAQSLDMQKVSFLTIPGTDCREWGDSGAWYYILSREGAWETVNTYLNVYCAPIDGKLFDKTYRLTDQSNPTLLSYYRTHISPNQKTGSDIAENGVSIAVN